MEKNRQKTESTQCQPEMQPAGASTQPTLNQHPLKEYSKYVTFNVMGMIGVSCYILADTFFVSKALGAQGLAALNLALPIFNAIRGIGLIWGIDMSKAAPVGTCRKVVTECFKNHLIIEQAGRDDCVLKLMPALTIPEEELKAGLEIIEKSIKAVLHGEQ